jgi:hypothetical protein
VTRVRAIALTGAVLALAACDGVGQACPAIGWGSTLTVELAPDWPPGEGRSVEVGCPEPCGLPALGSTPSGPIREGVAPLTGTSTALSFVMETPDSVVVPVLGPDGAVLAEVAADLDWERVGGSEECGGPMAATVTVPAP